MDNKYRITVTDLETGQVAADGGMAARCDTSFGLVVALGGHSEAGDAFFTNIVADHERGVSRLEVMHLFDACFHAFGQMIRNDPDPSTCFSLSVMAFTRYIEEQIKAPLMRHALYAALAEDAAKQWEASRK